MVKRLPAMRETSIGIPGLARSPGEGKGSPLQYSGLEKSMERGPVGYSPWGHIESDMTEFDLSQTSLQEEIIKK